MDDLDTNTFIITAIGPLLSHRKYREYKLHKDSMTCDQRYGSDQSSVGQTSLKGWASETRRLQDELHCYHRFTRRPALGKITLDTGEHGRKCY
jgi:hypothetical protein